MAKKLRAGEQPTVNTKTQSQFLALAADIRTAKQAMDDERSELGNMYKRAEDIGFDKRAMKLAIKLAAEDPAKANDFLANFETYCAWLNVGAQLELLDRKSLAAGEGVEAAPAFN